MSSRNPTDVFRAETDNGHVFKVFVENLSGLGFSRCTFTLSKRGIFSREMDQGKKILFDFKVENERCKYYKYDLPEQEIYLMYTVSSFKKLVNSIKKKDSISFFIPKENANNITGLGFTITPKNISSALPRSDESIISVTRVESPTSIDLPGTVYTKDEKEYPTYWEPVVFDTSELQRLKKPCMSASEKNGVNITIQEKDFVSFFGTNAIDQNRITFGTYYHDRLKYEKKFETSIMTQISKISGFGGYTKIYAPNISVPELERYPLKISSDVGRIGTFTIYIKDIEELERYRKEQLDIKITEESTRKRRNSKRTKK